MNTKRTQLILALTCAHCGRQRHFSGDGIDVFQLMYVDAQTCNHCGKQGATLTMTSNFSAVPFDPAKLEPLPCLESPATRRPTPSGR